MYGLSVLAFNGYRFDFNLACLFVTQFSDFQAFHGNDPMNQESKGQSQLDFNSLLINYTF